jgi:hypothetical protein
VKLTVHRADLQGPIWSFGGGPIVSMKTDSYFITITNASRDRDIMVTHIWIETEPPVHVNDPDLPVRLKYSAPWETSVSWRTCRRIRQTFLGWRGVCSLRTTRWSSLSPVEMFRRLAPFRAVEVEGIEKRPLPLVGVRC